jgi:hypothetical protein
MLLGSKKREGSLAATPEASRGYTGGRNEHETEKTYTVYTGGVPGRCVGNAGRLVRSTVHALLDGAKYYKSMTITGRMVVPYKPASAGFL